MLRRSLTTAIALSLIGAYSLQAMGLSAAEASSTGVRFPIESQQAYEQQLAGGQIQAVKFNTEALLMHLTLSDGKQVSVPYPAHQEAKLVATLKARGVSVPAIKAAKHTRRYITGGAVIVVLLVIGAAVLFRRKRV